MPQPAQGKPVRISCGQNAWNRLLASTLYKTSAKIAVLKSRRSFQSLSHNRLIILLIVHLIVRCCFYLILAGLSILGAAYALEKLNVRKPRKASCWRWYFLARFQ